MKKSELQQIIREEISKVLNEDTGVFVSYSSMGAIRRTLVAVNGNKNLINALQKYKDTHQGLDEIEKLLYKHRQEIYDALKQLKDINQTDKSGYNPDAFDSVMASFEKLVSGKAKFVSGS